MTVQRKIIFIYLITLIGGLIWIAAIFYAPYLKSQSSPFSGLLYAAFSPTCHQIPSRCFYAFGYPAAVCARCLGIYTGFFLGSLLFPFVKGFSSVTMPKAKTLILISLPIFVDAAANIIGIWTSHHWVRFITGSLWGLILPFYFFAGITDIMLRKGKKHFRVEP
jgi:uncharacterized membrane protein